MGIHFYYINGLKNVIQILEFSLKKLSDVR